MSHVAGDEHAGHTGLKQERVTIERPALRSRTGGGARQIWACKDIPLCVAQQDTCDPIRAWLRANEDKES